MIVDHLLLMIEQINFSELDLNMILDERDLPEFDTEWIKIYNELEMTKSKQKSSDSDKRLCDQIRANAYKKVYGITQNSDLAGYISDDFGLICDSERLNYQTAWLDKLIACYQNAKVPCGKL